jgi:hypothetical protein
MPDLCYRSNSCPHRRCIFGNRYIWQNTKIVVSARAWPVLCPVSCFAWRLLVNLPAAACGLYIAMVGGLYIALKKSVPRPAMRNPDTTLKLATGSSGSVLRQSGMVPD